MDRKPTTGVVRYPRGDNSGAVTSPHRLDVVPVSVPVPVRQVAPRQEHTTFTPRIPAPVSPVVRFAPHVPPVTRDVVQFSSRDEKPVVPAPRTAFAPVVVPPKPITTVDVRGATTEPPPVTRSETVMPPGEDKSESLLPSLSEALRRSRTISNPMTIKPPVTRGGILRVSQT